MHTFIKRVVRYSGWRRQTGLRPSTELLRPSSQASSVLDPSGDAACSGNLCMAGRDIASLPAGQGGFFQAPSPDIAFRWLVNHHRGRIHSGQRVHAALARGVVARGAQLQLVVAGHLNERTPAERSLEARSKPGGHTRRRGGVNIGKVLMKLIDC